MKPKPLTWDELAKEYDADTGGHARTMKMSTVFAWAEKQPTKFTVDKDGYIYKVPPKEDKS